MQTASVATLVSVRLVYLARLREAFARERETLEFAADTLTVGAILDALRCRGGAWASELAPGRAVRFAVNHRLVGATHPVADGDEVAIFPPVTGG
ncbi:MAG TPA: MoaD/ThiS family protein [Casimicrobiaceae bacterium]|nr:MoaD/ThiS family protein [Casimicrobiaceae bacterium]